MKQLFCEASGVSTFAGAWCLAILLVLAACDETTSERASNAHVDNREAKASKPVAPVAATYFGAEFGDTQDALQKRPAEPTVQAF